jgi:hypothetical protein
MPRTEGASAESDSSNATLCDSCSKSLQKPLVCARCKTATYYCSKDWQVHTSTADKKRGVDFFHTGVRRRKYKLGQTKQVRR